MADAMLSALVVDDDEVAREMIGFALRKEGFFCEFAIDGNDALAATREKIFDLVITDILMPNAHGHALATELLGQAKRPLIVIHTSVSEPRIAKDLMARGVDDIVFKPTDYGALAAKMKMLVQRRKKLHAEMSNVLSSFGYSEKG